MSSKIESNRPLPLPSPAFQPTQNPALTTRSQSTIESLKSSEASQSFWDQLRNFFQAILDFLCCRSKSEPQNSSVSLKPVLPPLENPASKPSIVTPEEDLFDWGKYYFPSEEVIYSYLQQAMSTDRHLMELQKHLSKINPSFPDMFARALAQELAYKKMNSTILQHKVKEIYETLNLPSIPKSSSSEKVVACIVQHFYLNYLDEEPFSAVKITPLPPIDLCHFPAEDDLYLHVKIGASSSPAIPMIPSTFFEKVTRAIAHEFANTIQDAHLLGSKVKEIYQMHCLSSSPSQPQNLFANSIAPTFSTTLLYYMKKSPPTMITPSPLPPFHFLPKEELSQKREAARAWIQARWINETDFDNFLVEHIDTLNQLPATERIWILYELLSHVRLVTKLARHEELQEAHVWIRTRAQNKDSSLNYERLEKEYAHEFTTLPALQQLWILYALLRSMQQGDQHAQSVIHVFSLSVIPA